MARSKLGKAGKARCEWLSDRSPIGKRLGAIDRYRCGGEVRQTPFLRIVHVIRHPRGMEVDLAYDSASPITGSRATVAYSNSCVLLRENLTHASGSPDSS